MMPVCVATLRAGVIPEELADLTMLRELVLSHNNLTGKRVTRLQCGETGVHKQVEEIFRLCLCTHEYPEDRTHVSRLRVGAAALYDLD